MREIKFRAWDKENKKMFNISSFYWEEYGDDEYDLNKSLSREEYSPLMQFTGLKDKNGVEIYEGDIVKHRNSIIEVKWWARGWWSPFTDLFSNGVEVIGNIYENPELITQK